MTARLDAEAALRVIADAPDAPIDMGPAALALAVLDRPRAAPARYQIHLEELSGDVAQSAAGCGDDLQRRADALNGVLFGQHGYDEIGRAHV